jgi:hypothetical protein
MVLNSKNARTTSGKHLGHKMAREQILKMASIPGEKVAKVQGHKATRAAGLKTASAPG